MLVANPTIPILRALLPALVCGFLIAGTEPRWGKGFFTFFVCWVLLSSWPEWVRKKNFRYRLEIGGELVLIGIICGTSWFLGEDSYTGEELLYKHLLIPVAAFLGTGII